MQCIGYVAKACHGESSGTKLFAPYAFRFDATTAKGVALRRQRRIRRSQHSRIFRDARGQIPEAISIRERPAEVEDRAVPGHWEGDLLRGSRNSHIATLVERHSRFTALVKVPSKDTVTCEGNKSL
jgi:IS30 family transposase